MSLGQAKKITDVCLLVEDIQRTVDFYVDKLGFRLRRRAEGFADFHNGGITLAAWELDDRREIAELLVSELVTNAIVHAHSPSQLSVRVDGGTVHVEVEDWGGGALVLRDPDPLTPGGRGLRFVEALAARWGTASTGNGKSVWFELPLGAGQPLVRAGD